ncbi:MAG: hypothetical protein ABI388_01735 [Bacteroidia bacterium]
MNAQDSKYIHPEDSNNVIYWRNKLGISTRELYDAILYTGSTDINDIKNYLKKEADYYSPMFGLWQSIKKKIVFLN